MSYQAIAIKTSCKSSSIEAFGVLKKVESNTTEVLVEFKSGALYHYTDAPENIELALASAPSLGNFISEALVKASVPFSRLGNQSLAPIYNQLANIAPVRFNFGAASIFSI